VQSVAREEDGGFCNPNHGNAHGQAGEETFRCNRKTFSWRCGRKPAQLSTHDQRSDEREKWRQRQQAERDKHGQRREGKNRQIDERIERGNHDGGGVSKAGEPKTVWIVAANRKPNLKLSERRQKHQEHVPTRRNGIKKHLRADVRGAFDGDGNRRQYHASEQCELMPGSVS